MVLTVTLPCARVRKVYIGGGRVSHPALKFRIILVYLPGNRLICGMRLQGNGVMTQRNIEDRMIFAASCIESVAKEWNLPPDEVYRRMKRVNLIEGYILKHYEAIHAESRENITEDIAGCLLQWEKAEKQEEPV